MIRPLEINYPNIPGLIDAPVGVETLLPDYISYIYQLLISISGIAIFAAAFMTGVKMMISIGKPYEWQKAKKDLTRIGVGVLIIFFSYLIIKTINPEIISPDAGVRHLDGVTIYENSSCAISESQKGKVTTSKGSDDLEDEMGFKPSCLKFNSDPEMLDVHIFSEKDYGGTEEVLSGDEQTVSFSPAGSMKIKWNIPGVYLCTAGYTLESDVWVCPEEEGHLSLSSDIVDEEFRDNLEGIRINDVVIQTEGVDCESHGGYIEGSSCLRKYGIMFHDEKDNKGLTEILNTGAITKEEEIEFLKDLEGENPFMEREPIFDLKNSQSLTIFSPSKEPRGEGVYFCEEPDPNLNSKPNCYGPFKNVMGTLGEEVNDKITGASLEVVPNAQGCAQQWFGEGGGVSSLIIDGNYMVVLFRADNLRGRAEVFDKSDLNLIDNYIGDCCPDIADWQRSDCSSSVAVVPTTYLTQSFGRVPSSLPTCEDQCEANYIECFEEEPNWSYKKCSDIDVDPCLDWPKKWKPCEDGYRCINDAPENPCQR